MGLILKNYDLLTDQLKIITLDAFSQINLTGFYRLRIL
jgi:hypothetical protein